MLIYSERERERERERESSEKEARGEQIMAHTLISSFRAHRGMGLRFSPNTTTTTTTTTATTYSQSREVKLSLSLKIVQTNPTSSSQSTKWVNLSGLTFPGCQLNFYSCLNGQERMGDAAPVLPVLLIINTSVGVCRAAVCVCLGFELSSLLSHSDWAPSPGVPYTQYPVS